MPNKLCLLVDCYAISHRRILSSSFGSCCDAVAVAAAIAAAAAVCVRVCLSVCVSGCQRVKQPAHKSVRLSVCLSAYGATRLFVRSPN